MNPINWERHDRDLERADGCVGCRHHAEACTCPTRLPTRLRLVTDQPVTSRAAVHHLRSNHTRPGICGPEAA